MLKVCTTCQMGNNKVGNNSYILPTLHVLPTGLLPTLHIQPTRLLPSLFVLPTCVMLTTIPASMFKGNTILGNTW